MKVLYVDIDTLRPDHMGCYGYHRNTTPNIDAVAAQGLRFNQYYCSDAPCLPSRAALISGKFGIHNGAVGHGGTAGDMVLTGPERDFQDQKDVQNFTNLFRNAGMYTASVSTFAERHSSWWFNAGFNECINVGGCGSESGETVLPAVLSWLDRNQQRKDWYLHVHFWDPHTPYRAPEEFGNPFADEPLNTWITPEKLQEHLHKVGPHSANEIGMYTDRENPKYPRHPGRVGDMQGLRKLMDGYDCGIRYADTLIGQIFDKLRQQKIYDEVAIIISSDHGENIGELAIYSEHGTADYPTCHIPMIIKWPGLQNVGGTDDALHYNIDLVPTVAQLLSQPVCEAWDGESYASTITKGEACGRDNLILSQMAHVCQRSARFGDYIYIRTIHDGFRLLDDEMLFNVKEDPHEQHDCKAQHPELCALGAKYILDWQEACMKKTRQQIDPMWTVYGEKGPFHAQDQLLPPYLERLEKTGRKDGADALRKKYHVK